jgi:hypothetical protein
MKQDDVGSACPQSVYPFRYVCCVFNRFLLWMKWEIVMDNRNSRYRFVRT